MKRIFALILLCSGIACAQTFTVSGHVVNPNTGVPTGMTITFSLINTGTQQCKVSGTGLIVPNNQVFTPDGTGTISGTLYRNDFIVCGNQSNTQWQYQILGPGVSMPRCALAAVTTTSLNVDSATCTNTVAVVTPPTGDTTYCRLDGSNCGFTGNITLNAHNIGSIGSLTATSINSIQFADQFAGADGGQKINAAIAACPAAGCTVFAQGLGAHTWSTTVFPGNKAVDLWLPAATITLTLGQAIPENINIHCVPSTDTTHGTTFSGTLNTGSWFSFTDMFTSTMDGCSFVKTGSAGGTLFSVIGSKFVILKNFQNINGNWNDVLFVNSDATGSAIYNHFEDWFAQGWTNNFIHLNATGGAGKVTTANRFLNLVGSGSGTNTCILFDSGATAAIGENLFDVGDCTGGTTGLNINTNQARDNTFRGEFFENMTGTGVNIASGAIDTTFLGCQVTGNGTNFTDAGSSTVVIGNVAGVSRQWAVTPAGDTNFNSIGIGAAGSANPGGINMANGNTIEAGGTNSIQFLSGGEALYLKFNGWNETTAPAGAASEDRCYGDSTLHGRVCNPNNSVWSPTGTRTILTADWTCGTGGTVSTCAAATIIGSGGGVAWTFNLPLVANSFQLDCDGVVAQTTAATVNQWNLITATNGATNVTAYYAFPVNGATAPTLASNTYTTDQASTTSTFQIGGSWTLGALIGAAKYPFHIHAAIEAASASGTVLSVQLLAPTPGDLVTIFRGSGCWVHP